MTKREMAELMVEHFPEGCQARRYWFNRYMRIRKSGLEQLLDLKTDPARVPGTGTEWLTIVEGVEAA